MIFLLFHLIDLSCSDLFLFTVVAKCFGSGTNFMFFAISVFILAIFLKVMDNHKYFMRLKDFYREMI